MSALQMLLLVGVLLCFRSADAKIYDVGLVTNFTVNLVKTKHTVLFACSKEDLLATTRALLHWNQMTMAVHLGSQYTLASVLSRKSYARTALVVDCSCKGSARLLEWAAMMHSFNKTYQWLLWDTANTGLAGLLPVNLDYLGPNAQVTYVNGSGDSFLLWDVHSKGLHLNAPLEVKLLAEWCRIGVGHFITHLDIFQQQGIHQRGQFNGLTLRGAAVIDQDNISSNAQITRILSHSGKDSGVATFVKYHFDLLQVLSERFNFTVNFRNSRGWAGRLGNSTFRLGLLGVVSRNEADVAASGAFNRINRFAEFDTIHQSWKFETAFLYRFTPDLDTHAKSGNFLAPFDDGVWVFAIATLFVVSFVWRLVEWLKNRWRLSGILGTQQVDGVESSFNQTEVGENSDNLGPDDGTSLSTISLNTFAAVCQQGMEPLPSGLSSRTIILTIILFSLLMYNFYTSSVVGGLLSNTAHGPATVEDIVDSPLKLSFEDIGYYKVMFSEHKSPIIRRLHNLKVIPKRSTTDLPVYTHVEDAIPYLKRGGYGFHCEVIDAYPGIAKLFDVDEICDLRMVSGLLETEVFPWIVPKRSQYTEIFRVVMNQAREVGIVKRTLYKWRPKKPECQALYRVFPISLSGVLSAFIILGGGYLCAVIALVMERRLNKRL